VEKLLSRWVLNTSVQASQGQLIKREEILTHLWKEPDFFSGRSMDVFISRLRKYLSGDPAVHLESVRGMGYQFYIEEAMK